MLTSAENHDLRTRSDLVSEQEVGTNANALPQLNSRSEKGTCVEVKHIQGEVSKSVLMFSHGQRHQTEMIHEV